ncbi:hypothetical protein Ciccas_004501 [Cichlidogyrus casuarinus]|uniref:Uncharacterized protein n=1 Tax=Cichlidogyrus casuarinus TaxID=1844966 RepID=A0ABD2QDP2_9PLAT
MVYQQLVEDDEEQKMPPGFEIQVRLQRPTFQKYLNYETLNYVILTSITISIQRNFTAEFVLGPYTPREKCHFIFNKDNILEKFLVWISPSNNGQTIAKLQREIGRSFRGFGREIQDSSPQYK